MGLLNTPQHASRIQRKMEKLVPYQWGPKGSLCLLGSPFFRFPPFGLPCCVQYSVTLKKKEKNIKLSKITLNST